jgi:hypothetical protein
METYSKASGKKETFDNVIKIPFFTKILKDFNNKLSYIIASEIYPISLAGGLSPEQILTSPFIYLTHATHIEYLEQILQSGYLKPSHTLIENKSLILAGINGYLQGEIGNIENLRFDRYPNIQSDTEAYENLNLDVTFIISLSLLKVEHGIFQCMKYMYLYLLSPGIIILYLNISLQ